MPVVDEVDGGEKMKIFCTGASGYIGGSVAAYFVAAGHQVTGLVRSPEKADAVRARSGTAVSTLRGCRYSGGRIRSCAPDASRRALRRGVALEGVRCDEAELRIPP